jgi:amino acid adenylation domain-containing protein
MSESMQVGEEVSEIQKAIRAKCLHPGGAFTEFRKEEVEQAITDRFEQQVEKYPERQAVQSRRHAFTYTELNTVANRVARTILEKRGEGAEPIGLLLEQDAPTFAAILGVLKTGKLYVPMLPSYPQERLRSMLDDSGARLIITNSDNIELAGAIVRDCDLINVDAIDSAPVADNLGLRFSPESLAYILYTSGSTGEPKGVVQNHRNILHKTMTYTNDFHFCAEDRFALFCLFNFSLSVGFTFGALLNGACLYPIDVKEEGLETLTSWLGQERITVFNSVPTVFRALGDSLNENHTFPEMRLIHLGGEQVTLRDVKIYKKHFSPSCIFIHHLGSNETGTIAQYFIDKITPIDTSTVPAGYPNEDTEILLFDEQRQEISRNQIGEIAVKSHYLSPGYWRKPELTETLFLPLPNGDKERVYLTGDLGLMLPDGRLMHLGRKDFQAKIRGNRVDVLEIELALRGCGAIKEAVVLAREDTAGSKRLVAYIVPDKEPRPKTSELRRWLTQKVPEYMVPAAFVFLEALPLTPNGKIDRTALPAPWPARPELSIPYVAPQTPLEEELARIWAQVLGLDRVGIHDNFLDLGGHSIAGAQVISRIINSFRLEIPAHSLFQAPTVAEMARLIIQSEMNILKNKNLPKILTELESLSDEEARELANREGTGNRRGDAK